MDRRRRFTVQEVFMEPTKKTVNARIESLVDSVKEAFGFYVDIEVHCKPYRPYHFKGAPEGIVLGWKYRDDAVVVDRSDLIGKFKSVMVHYEKDS